MAGRWRIVVVVVVVVVGAAVASCSKSTPPDPCDQAFAKLAATGVFGGDNYAGETALGFGMACADLTKDDLACIGKATTPDDLDACKHASIVVSGKLDDLHSAVSGAKPGDAKPVIDLSDAVCACKDATCVVGVGRKQRDAIEKMLKSPPPDDPKALAAQQRMGECIRDLPAPATAPAKGKDERKPDVQAGRGDAARQRLQSLVGELFAKWATDHPDAACPTSLHELITDTKDPWGNDLVMFCGANAPPDMKAPFGVLSLGPDGKQGTDDDLASWK